MRGVTDARLAVWGDPISHSRSPQLHTAAYRVLGLDWEYGRRQVTASGFAAAIAERDPSWRGLSLTMPLKEAAFAVADDRDTHANLTGVANTLLFDDGVHAFNTDIGGIVDALRDAGITSLERVRILGAGATAASAIAAARELGAGQAEVRARRPERAESLIALGHQAGIDVTVTTFSAPALAVDMTMATLPGGAQLSDDILAPLRAEGGDLFEAAYDPWPSPLAASWTGGRVVSGLGMLLHQAVRQVRVFVNGDPLRPVEDERDVVSAMRSALGDDGPAD